MKAYIFKFFGINIIILLMIIAVNMVFKNPAQFQDPSQGYQEINGL